MKYFTELRFKKTEEVHDSEYSCIQVIGYNSITKEEPVVLTTYSDVIHLPFIDFDKDVYRSVYSKKFGALSIDVRPDEDYFRLFVTGSNYRIAVEVPVFSDFLFNVIEVDEV